MRKVDYILLIEDAPLVFLGEYNPIHIVVTEETCANPENCDAMESDIMRRAVDP